MRSAIIGSLRTESFDILVAAKKATREADRAEARSIHMEGGTVGRRSPRRDRTMLNGGYGWLQVMPSLRNRGQHSACARPPAPGHADLETRGRSEVLIMPDAALLAPGSHDQAHTTA